MTERGGGHAAMHAARLLKEGLQEDARPLPRTRLRRTAGYRHLFHLASAANAREALPETPEGYVVSALFSKRYPPKGRSRFRDYAPSFELASNDGGVTLTLQTEAAFDYSVVWFRSPRRARDSLYPRLRTRRKRSPSLPRRGCDGRRKDDLASPHLFWRQSRLPRHRPHRERRRRRHLPKGDLPAPPAARFLVRLGSERVLTRPLFPPEIHAKTTKKSGRPRRFFWWFFDRSRGNAALLGISPRLSQKISVPSTAAETSPSMSMPCSARSTALRVGWMTGALGRNTVQQSS